MIIRLAQYCCLCLLMGQVLSSSRAYLPRSSPNSLRQIQTQTISRGQSVIIEKHIYFYSAPEPRSTHTQRNRARTAATSATAAGGSVQKYQQLPLTKTPTNKRPSPSSVDINEFDASVTTQVVQNLVNQAKLTRKHHAPAASNPEVIVVEQHAPDEVEQIQQALVQRYGVKRRGALNRNFLSPSVNTESGVKIVLPPNTPLPKNYAQNFLPVDKDVTPGSSYIPLVLK